MDNLNNNMKLLATTTYAVVFENQAGEKQLEIGWESAEKLLGDRLEDGTENVPSVDGVVRLHLDELGNNADTRRGITRNNLERLTGVRLEDSWESDAGFLRLAAEHPHSLVPQLVGQKVVVEAKDGQRGGVFWNLVFPRQKAKGLTLDELKAKLAARNPF